VYAKIESASNRCPAAKASVGIVRIDGQDRLRDRVRLGKFESCADRILGSFATHTYRFASPRKSNPGFAASSGVSVLVVPMMRLAAALSPALLTDSTTASLPSRKPKVENARVRDRRARPIGRRHARGPRSSASNRPDRSKTRPVHCRAWAGRRGRPKNAAIIQWATSTVGGVQFLIAVSAE
jgi:hypothetical protein